MFQNHLLPRFWKMSLEKQDVDALRTAASARTGPVLSDATTGKGPGQPLMHLPSCCSISQQVLKAHLVSTVSHLLLISKGS